MSAEDYIIGVDEAGRGAWAGDLVVCAVAVPVSWTSVFAKDSKKLPEKVLEEAHDALVRDERIHRSIEICDLHDIDLYGIQNAHIRAMRRAIGLIISNMAGWPDKISRICVDGLWPSFLPGVECIPQADESIPAVSAASILAKHNQSALMRVAHKQYCGYGFDKHKGYGTAEHRRTLHKHGLCPLHRVSFKPMCNML